MRVLATFAHLLIEELFGIFLKLRQTVMAAEKIVLSVVIELPPQRCWRLLSCRKQDQSNLLYSNLPFPGTTVIGEDTPAETLLHSWSSKASAVHCGALCPF